MEILTHVFSKTHVILLLELPLPFITVLISTVCIGSSIDVNGPLRLDHDIMERCAVDMKKIDVQLLLLGVLIMFPASRRL